MPEKKVGAMNKFMILKEKARKANADQFKYTSISGKTKVYRRAVTKTGMVIYKAS